MASVVFHTFNQIGKTGAMNLFDRTSLNSRMGSSRVILCT